MTQHQKINAKLFNTTTTMIEIQGTAILRDGENIGTITENTAFLPKKPGPAILGQIRKAAGKPELAFEYVAAPVAVSTIQSIAPVVPSGQTKNNEGESISGKPVAGSSVTVAPEESGQSANDASPKTGLDRLLDLVDDGKIPAPPECNPAMGDKAPEFVAWFKAHAWPEEIEAKYPATRRLPKPGEFEAAELRRLNRKLDGEVEDKAD
jgi:hypothetical protein